MKCTRVFMQIIMLIALATTGNATSTCLLKVNQLELKIEGVVLSRGMWSYFWKNHDLKKLSGGYSAGLTRKQNTLPLLFNQPYLSQALEETLRALTRTLRKVTLDDWTVCPKRKSYYINVLLEE